MEIGALLEDFNSKFDLVAEQTAQIPDIKNKINGLAESMEIVKLDLEFIKNSFKKKVDIDEFAALTKNSPFDKLRAVFGFRYWPLAIRYWPFAT